MKQIDLLQNQSSLQNMRQDDQITIQVGKIRLKKVRSGNLRSLQMELLVQQAQTERMERLVQQAQMELMVQLVLRVLKVFKV